MKIVIIIFLSIVFSATAVVLLWALWRVVKRIAPHFRYAFQHPLWFLKPDRFEAEAVRKESYLWVYVKGILLPDSLPFEDAPLRRRRAPGFRDIFRPDTLPLEEDAPRRRRVPGFRDIFRPDETLPLDDPALSTSRLGLFAQVFKPEKLETAGDETSSRPSLLKIIFAPDKLPDDNAPKSDDPSF